MKNDFIIALHCLLLLAFHENERFSSATLAEKTCSNPVTIRRIMSLLHKAAYVETQQGPTGGYRLSQPAENIRLGNLYIAIKEAEFELKNVRDNLDMSCLVAQHMDGFVTGLQQEMLQEKIQFLNTKTLADYLKQIQLVSTFDEKH